MRKFLAIMAIAITMCLGCTKVHAQVGNPFWPYTGIGTMICMDGVYYGWIYMGFAQGEGYYYFYDGSVFHGYFKAGRPHGRGEVLTCMGYIAGEWSNGQFVHCVSMPQQQIQNYYQQAQSNYCSTPQVQNSYRSSAQKDFALSNYTIEDVSDTQFGKQLMGKMGK